LLAAHQPHRLFLDHRLAPAALVQATLDPLVAIGALLLSAFAFGKTFEGPYLILALIVFSLTFPEPLRKAPAAARSLVTSRQAGLWSSHSCCLSVGRREHSLL